MRTCNACHVPKPLEAFAEIGFRYRDRPRYRRHVCRECHRRQQRGQGQRMKAMVSQLANAIGI